MEANEDFSQLWLRCIDPAQYSFELIRPVPEGAGDDGPGSQSFRFQASAQAR